MKDILSIFTFINAIFWFVIPFGITISLAIFICCKLKTTICQCELSITIELAFGKLTLIAISTIIFKDFEVFKLFQFFNLWKLWFMISVKIHHSLICFSVLAFDSIKNLEIIWILVDKILLLLDHCLRLELGQSNRNYLRAFLRLAFHLVFG